MQPRNPGVIIASVIAVVAVAGLLFMGRFGDAPDPDQAFSVPGLDPMTFEEAQQQFYRLTPALLLVVYDAFGRTDEDEIYDSLARVSGEDALEQLYLERVGAMAGGGLEEADQTIHEIRLLSSSAKNRGGAIIVDASWQVIGTVGHAEHLHVRGNTYNADLTISAVENAWKITGFELLDANREAAGETFPAPPTN